MRRVVLIAIGWAIFCCFNSASSFAAVGCSLNDPDRDIKRLFPESTGYKTEYISIQERGGQVLAAEVENKLNDKLDPVFESPDLAYTYYTILKGKQPIGRIHGVNQKGVYGGMQLILATDLTGRILSFYYQKISSPEAGKFRALSFADQFKGLTLADFCNQQVGQPGECTADKVSKITDPTENSHEDFQATLRGVKKNLILLDEFFIKKERTE